MFAKKSFLGYSTLLILILCNAFACDDDGYSLGDFRISIATVVPEGEQSYSLVLDNGDKLLPVATDVYYKPQANQRVFVNYTLLSDRKEGYKHDIKINDIWDILTKPIINLTEQSEDSIVNDPIQVNEFWIGDNYLNASFSFNYGHVKPHAINMVRNTMENEENQSVLELEFRHNSYNSPYNTLFDGFACFNLKPFIQDDRDSIPIVIKYKNWRGDQTYELMYKFNKLNKSSRLMTIPNISSNEYN